ncbi:hypothetical protein DUI87_14586 [Hirundo rustica rustica]|uniref:Uncharacterized protein n=1 Tax=Hirundo rustica rustica TaxID=333673 RepID=A0A3M0KAM2_HIRRU|nr:hypothetical protein DUI87_14586 [Hirundo rustica rustica]
MKASKPEFLCLIDYDPCHFPQLWFLAPAAGHPPRGAAGSTFPFRADFQEESLDCSRLAEGMCITQEPQRNECVLRVEAELHKQTERGGEERRGEERRGEERRGEERRGEERRGEERRGEERRGEERRGEERRGEERRGEERRGEERREEERRGEERRGEGASNPILVWVGKKLNAHPVPPRAIGRDNFH